MVPAFGLVALVAAMIRISSSGPFIIGQRRVGLDGVEFYMFKLRTMFVDADDKLYRHLRENPEATVEWNRYGRLINDPRIAGKVACLARRYSIDELPQLLNVTLGHMNMVGPRPLPREILDNMALVDRHGRQAVRPGMTGLWQVSGRSDLDILEMGRIDSIYLMKRSLWFDFRILVRTVIAVVAGRGAY